MVGARLPFWGVLLLLGSRCAFGGGDEVCAEERLAWRPTGCGMEGVQGLVVDGSSYLVQRECLESAAVCGAREVFRTRDGCARWSVAWYATPLPAGLGLVASCAMPGRAPAPRLWRDGRVADGAWYGVEVRGRAGYSRR